MTAAGEILYISQDSEGYYLNRGYVPNSPLVPANVYERVDFSPSGSPGLPTPRRILEWGEANIQQAEGELSWTPEPKEAIGYAEYSSGGTTFGVEWRTPPGVKTPCEAEYYTASKLSFDALLNMFPLPALLAEYEALKRYRSERLTWGIPFLILGLILIGAFFATSGSGHRIFRGEVQHISGISSDGAVFGPIRLDAPHTIYRFGFQASIPDNSELWVGLELLDASQSPINGHDGDLWRESGYDEGEHYSEADLSRSQEFYLEEPGNYYLRLTREQDSSKPIDGSVQVYVDDNVIWSFNFLIAGIIGVAVSLFVLPLSLPRYPTLN
jgi:hypothetical protein